MLFWRWDPIGVQDGFPWSYDEYDTYAGAVAKKLREGASSGDIANQLEELEAGFGLATPDAGRSFRRSLAEFVVSWYPASIEHWKTRRT